MKQLRSTLLVALASIAALVTAGAHAGDAEAGKTKAAACAACHGEAGISNSPAWPNLAGQYEDYLVLTLRQYRSGERANAVMAGFATALSDEDIEDLAAYFASLPGLGTLPSK